MKTDSGMSRRSRASSRRSLQAISARMWGFLETTSRMNWAERRGRRTRESNSGRNLRREEVELSEIKGFIWTAEEAGDDDEEEEERNWRDWRERLSLGLSVKVEDKGGVYSHHPMIE